MCVCLINALFRESSESCGQHCSFFSKPVQRTMAVTVLEASLAAVIHASSPCAGKEKVQSAAGRAMWVAGLGLAGDGLWTDLPSTESRIECKLWVSAKTSANNSELACWRGLSLFLTLCVRSSLWFNLATQEKEL